MVEEYPVKLLEEESTVKDWRYHVCTLLLVVRNDNEDKGDATYEMQTH